MRRSEWMELKIKLPAFKNTIDTAIELQDTLERLSTSLDFKEKRVRMYIYRDIITLKQNLSRIVADVFLIIKESEVGNQEKEEFVRNISPVLDFAGQPKGSDKVLNKLDDKPSLAFYISDFRIFLGLLFDTLRETVIAINHTAKEEFSQIFVKKSMRFNLKKEEKKDE